MKTLISILFLLSLNCHSYAQPRTANVHLDREFKDRPQPVLCMDIEITLEAKDLTLEETFRMIENKTISKGCLISTAFLPVQIDPIKHVTFPKKNRTVAETYAIALQGTRLTFRKFPGNTSSVVVFDETLNQKSL